MRKDLMIWEHHVESTPYHEVRKHPAWEGGFVETRKSAQSWMKVCYHQRRYGVEITIESLFRDRTVSWVRIVNGIFKYVTEASEEIPVASVENRRAGKPVAKAKPRPKPTLTLTPVSIPYRERKWTRWSRKIQPRLFWSVKIHDQIVTTWWYSTSRRWWICKTWRPGRKVHGKVWWYFAIEAWITFLAKGGGPKTRFHYCMNPNLPNISCILEQFRDIQEVLSLILRCKTMSCRRTTSPSTSTTSGSLTTCTLSSMADRFQ